MRPRHYVPPLAAVLILSYSVLLPDRQIVRQLTFEDGPVEWTGTIAFFVAAGLFFAAFRRAQHAEDHSHWGRTLRVSLLMLALLMFAAGGEEISWGQRLLGISTPAVLEAANAQGETNVHNLRALDGVLSPGRLFKVFYLGFVLLVPVSAAVSRRAHSFLERRVPIVPLSIGFLFVFSQGVTEAVQRMVSSDFETYAGEVSEANTAMLLAVAALAVYGEVCAHTAVRRAAPRSPSN